MGKRRDVRETRIQGVYVLDMIAHNNERESNVFQIAPGASPASFWLALQAHFANEAWNALTEKWNQHPTRRERGRRSPHGAAIPEVAAFPRLSGEIRPPTDPQRLQHRWPDLSDAGVPVVLHGELRYQPTGHTIATTQ